MNLLRLTLLLIWVAPTAQASAEKDALNHIQKAIVEVPVVKKRVKVVSNKIIHKYNLDHPTVSYMIMIGMPMAEGKIRSSAFKGLKYKKGNLTISPEIEYDLNSGESEAKAVLKYGF